MAYMNGFYSTAEGERWFQERLNSELRSWSQYLMERGEMYADDY